MCTLVKVSKTVGNAPQASELVPCMQFEGHEGYVKVSDCLLHPILKQLGQMILLLLIFFHWSAWHYSHFEIISKFSKLSLTPPRVAVDLFQKDAHHRICIAQLMRGNTALAARLLNASYQDCPIASLPAFFFAINDLLYSNLL